MERSLRGPRLLAVRPASHAFRFPSVQSRGPRSPDPKDLAAVTPLRGWIAAAVRRPRAVAWPPYRRCSSLCAPNCPAGKRAAGLASWGQCRSEGGRSWPSHKGGDARASRNFF